MQNPSAAKRRLPAWLLWTAPLPLLIICGWGVAVLYVQRVVARDIAAFRAAFHSTSPPSEYRWNEMAGAAGHIYLQGCRALPGLMVELQSDDDPAYAEVLSSLIHKAILASHAFERGTPRASEIIQRMNAMRVEPTDPPEARKAKIEALHAWWRENGSDYHQRWRFWSTACRAPLLKDF